MSLRPKRCRIENEIGQPKTLPSGAKAFERRGRGAEFIFFGLGPEPGKLPAYFPEVKSARFIECPEFEAQMEPGWAEAIPEGFSRMDPDELTPEVVRRSKVYVYLENQRLFPSFWGPVVARRALAHLAAAPPATERTVWLTVDEGDLLSRELRAAFEVQGFSTERVAPQQDDPERPIPWLIAQHRPELFFSVNFKGLDPHGQLAHLLLQSGARVAVWCVDNPFHLLTSVKSNYWKQIDLFVTDDWFLEPLRQLGAGSVHHLPLATSPGLFASAGEGERFRDLKERLVFVGRSAFPQKNRFFSGIRLDPEDWRAAESVLERGERRGFGWWVERLGIERLWPGNEVRAAGLGAEEIGRAWRARCMREAGPRLTVFGDAGWKGHVPPETDLRGPVDYYAELPKVYRRAACVLNMTSPLLPRGLTQRHFDVWAAGGFLLTDDTPGLSIFPQELTREITFKTPEEIGPLFDRFGASGAGAAVAAAWRELIQSAHTYRHRVRAVLDAVGIS